MSNTFTRDPLPRIQYSGDGTRTTFAFPFEVLNSDDLLVYLDDSAATGFAISGLGDASGGEVEFAQAPDAGTTLTLLRRTEGIRETAFVDGGPFRASAINAELDRIMMLIQEDREEHGRSLRGRPTENGLDFCLPAAGARANKLLGFDSSGAPTAFGITEVPDGGEASGLVVMPNGATVARALGEHLASVVNVRDFGAMGDGTTDDSAAFQAAITAAQGKASPVYVPASLNPYLLGSSLVLDGVTLFGAGTGSMLELGFASGAGVQLSGTGARLADLRLLGPGATAWPTSAAQANLSGVALDGVRVAAGAEGAVVSGVAVAGCHTGLALEGAARAIVDCEVAFNRNGVELRAGAAGPLFMSRVAFRACTTGTRIDPASTIGQLSLRGAEFTACGFGVTLEAPTSGWRNIELSDLRFSNVLEAGVQAGPRQTVAIRGAQLDAGGRRRKTGIDLLALGQTVEAPSVIAENVRAETTQAATVALSGGTNLNLLQPGDLIVLASDADDVDDLWTSLKATRGGVVHTIPSQTTGTASVRLAKAAMLPLVAPGDSIRVVGRSGVATVDSVGAIGPANQFVWLRADDHCRVFAAHDPMPANRIELLGSAAQLTHLPGLGGEPAAVAGVAFSKGTINGGFARLVTLEIAPNTAVSFTPDSTIGMVHAFGHGSLGDPIGCVFSYRADAVGYTQLIAGPSTVATLPPTALTGTTGTAGKFTFSAHTDGKIYVENRLTGTWKVSLYVLGVPL